MKRLLTLIVIILTPSLVHAAEERALGPAALQPWKVTKGSLPADGSGVVTVPTAILYSSITQSGFRFNPADTNRIAYDDIRIPVARLGANTFADVSRVQVGIRQIAGAPAVTVDVFVSTLTTGTTPPDTEINPPGTLLCSVSLPAQVASVTSLVNCGTGAATIANVALNMTLFAGNGSLAVGVRVSSADILNGWRLTTGPDTNGDFFWMFSPVGTAPSASCPTPPCEEVFNFGAAPVAIFMVEVEGTAVLTPVELMEFAVE